VESIGNFVIAVSASLLIFAFSKALEWFSERKSGRPRMVEIETRDGRRFVLSENELTDAKLDELFGPVASTVSSH
jgi:hypothetical protein